MSEYDLLTVTPDAAPTRTDDDAPSSTSLVVTGGEANTSSATPTGIGRGPEHAHHEEGCAQVFKPHMSHLDFEDEELFINASTANEEDDYIPRVASEPPRSTFEDFQKGIVDVQYTYAGATRIIVGVRTKGPTSILEQVAVDIARYMRWGDVVEAQFAAGGPLPLFYNRVESIAHPRNGRAQAIIKAITEAHILPLSDELPWDLADGMDGTSNTTSRVSDDASLSMQHCRKRRAEWHDDTHTDSIGAQQEAANVRPSRKRAKIVIAF